jgi:hypothetical protein
MAMFITLTSVFLVLFVPRGTAEYVVSVLSLIIGVGLMVFVLIANAYTKK